MQNTKNNKRTLGRYKEGKITMVLAKFDPEREQKLTMLANYKNFYPVLKREAIKIVVKHKTINIIELVLVEDGWQEILRSKHAYAKKKKKFF